MPLFIDKLAVSSPDFGALETIPTQFTADGGSAVPRIEIEGAPEGTVEFALICNDPDAPLPHGFTHWVVYGIPATATALDLDAEGVRGAPNGTGQAAWYGPQPPAGHGVHHYYFSLYALSKPVEGTPSREEFLAEYADSIIEQARTVGLFTQE
ncbi:YbhB/YbcL family Raf kinase inhibitor-like protein [Salinibacterium sp. NG253]|uniref:YbhB/YbcL family Raf kinase inhibitor-like protein n=1 Tax=Salinibacterium sp. NG253 TaxID=2792039 RepID=UPI0018CF8D01|nr:YbhB/YbcL family Raf kinase inhibitor-like protein [Salinibacterium sp. NG253]MBH0115916.1 YbhB/YbcL family Raf kinase inhibitor-like protein [Salinibacterium sp. NG253]